ncbi:MAG: hypothetical protein JXR20_12995 [Balneola sp.]
MKQFKNVFTIILVSASMLLMACGDDNNTTGPEPDPGRRAQLYVTNNNDGNITVYDVTSEETKVLTTSNTAAEGIYYDASNDIVVQASRSGNQLDAYSSFSETTDQQVLFAVASSSVDLNSPRELAVKNNSYVVSDNGSNQFYVYSFNGTAFTLSNTFDIPFPVWGITFKGDDLYAVVDQENELAVFSDFLSNSVDGSLNPSKTVTIEGIVRTHGLTYDGTDDVMIMTDIGEASNADSDGGFHVISGFSSKFDALSDGDVLSISDQVRVAGSATSLGNPIDVAYDSETSAVYISEIGNEGGKVVGFSDYSAGGDVSPFLSLDLDAASSIYFSSDETDGNTGQSSPTGTSELYVTNNATGSIDVFDLSDDSQRTLRTAATAAEGIYYHATADAVIQASRSDNQLEYFTSVSTALDTDSLPTAFASNADLSSPREIAVSGNKVVVSDNGSNEFYVYTNTGSGFTLENTFTTSFNVWGITFMGDDLLAVIDNTSDLAVFSDFLSSNTADGAISASKKITIDGIVRTHGITYSASDNVLVMTDIGDAANTTDDGAFHVINDFRSVLDGVANNGTLALSDQVRVGGLLTLMGNPIDVAYDHKTNTVYVTDVGAGRVLGYDNIGNGGNIVPNALNVEVVSASSIYYYGN